MFNLAEYRAKADRLADFIPWAALVAWQLAGLVASATALARAR